METVHFHLVNTKLFRTISFHIQGIPMNNLTPMRNCPWGFKVILIGCQGTNKWSKHTCMSIQKGKKNPIEILTFSYTIIIVRMYYWAISIKCLVYV